MSDQNTEKNNNLVLIFKTTGRDRETKEFVPVLELYYNQDSPKEQLEGWASLGGKKSQIVAHINKRQSTEGEPEKPNFFSVSEFVEHPDGDFWDQVGYGNVINHRSDGEPVYFDEAIFTIAGKKFNARLNTDLNFTKEFTQKLGFADVKKERPPIPEAVPENKASSQSKEEKEEHKKENILVDDETSKGTRATKARAKQVK